MDMGKRIEEAKKAAEAEYEARQKAKESLDVDLDDIFDGVDLDDEDELTSIRFSAIRSCAKPPAGSGPMQRT